MYHFSSLTNFKELPLSNIESFLNTVFMPVGCELTVAIQGLEALSQGDISSVISSLISQAGSNKCFCSLNLESGITNGLGGILEDVANPAEAVQDVLSPNLELNPATIIASVNLHINWLFF